VSRKGAKAQRRQECREKDVRAKDLKHGFLFSAFLASLRLCVTLLLIAGPAIADDKPEQFTYRVLGLFAKDREADLREGFEDIPEIKLVSVNFDDAEITVEFAPAKLFPGQKPDRVVELVNDKVRQATHHTFGVKPRSTVPKDKLQEVVIPVGGLDCKACCLAAYEIVAQVDGVMQATASFKDGKVTARFDPSKTDRAKLEEALRKRGVHVGPSAAEKK
jgi:copper chaperone CopZ